MILVELERELFEIVEKEFDRAKISPEWVNNPSSIASWKALEYLYDHNGTMTSKEFAHFIAEEDIRNSLLGYNIFSYHPSSRTVGFQSIPVRRYVEAKIGLPLPNSSKRIEFRKSTKHK